MTDRIFTMDPTLRQNFITLYEAHQDTDIVWDGLVNQDVYREQPTKILWLLREPWVPQSLTMLSDPGVYRRIGTSPTLHVMAYVTYSILNGYSRWEAMDYLRDDPDMADCLRGIGYINVKKSLGGTSSNLGDIHSWFARSSQLLKEQVESLTPDIIIGSYPYADKVMEWYGGTPKNSNDTASAFTSAGKVTIVAAPHPSARICRADMVNDIISLVESERQFSHKPE